MLCNVQACWHGYIYFMNTTIKIANLSLDIRDIAVQRKLAFSRNKMYILNAPILLEQVFLKNTIMNHNNVVTLTCETQIQARHNGITIKPVAPAISVAAIYVQRISDVMKNICS